MSLLPGVDGGIEAGRVDVVGTGRPDEVGVGAGAGANINVALPAGANGTAFRMAFDQVVAPAIDRFKPDWLLIWHETEIALILVRSGSHADLFG